MEVSKVMGVPALIIHVVFIFPFQTIHLGEIRLEIKFNWN